MPAAELITTTSTPPPALVVVDWLLTGASEQQVREALAARYPGVAPGPVMAEVQQHLVAAGNPSSDAVRGWALLAYRSLYQRLLQTGDYDGCRKCIREITMLSSR